MGMSLESQSGSYWYFNCLTWAAVLSVASRYGWKPAGTTPPADSPDSDWDGDYASNSGQCVESIDAGSMADALYLAMLDVDTSVVSDKDAFENVGEWPFEGHQFPGPEDVVGLRGFISFCRGGPFWID